LNDYALWRDGIQYVWVSAVGSGLTKKSGFADPGKNGRGNPLKTEGGFENINEGLASTPGNNLEMDPFEGAHMEKAKKIPNLWLGGGASNLEKLRQAGNRIGNGGGTGNLQRPQR